MYATLNDSYQWSQLNANGAMNNKIKTVLDKGEVLDFPIVISPF